MNAVLRGPAHSGIDMNKVKIRWRCGDLRLTKELDISVCLPTQMGAAVLNWLLTNPAAGLALKTDSITQLSQGQILGKGCFVLWCGV